MGKGRDKSAKKSMLRMLRILLSGSGRTSVLGLSLALMLFFSMAAISAAFLPAYADEVTDDTPSESDYGLTLENEYEDGGRSYLVEGTNYRIYINDQEDLLTDSDEEALLIDMLPVTDYGNVAFMTTKIASSSYEEATGDIYHSLFGNGADGAIFLIDMNHRQLIIYSDGAVYKVIKKNYANTITDNVYKLAKSEDYYECAKEVYWEMYTLLSGSKIAQPMRHITNAMLALILSTLILYFITRHVSRQRAAKEAEILSIIGADVQFENGCSTFANRSKVYNPHTSSDSGGGGGFGGGGGSSGGGGSHGF